MLRDASYGAVMMAASLVYRLPPSDFVPDSVRAARAARGPSPGPSVKVINEPQLTTHSVPVKTASRTPQFWLMWTGFGMAITGRFVRCHANLRTRALTVTACGDVRTCTVSSQLRDHQQRKDVAE